jgi:hypothetical protein
MFFILPTFDQTNIIDVRIAFLEWKFISWGLGLIDGIFLGVHVHVLQFSSKCFKPNEIIYFKIIIIRVIKAKSSGMMIIIIIIIIVNVC